MSEKLNGARRRGMHGVHGHMADRVSFVSKAYGLLCGKRGSNFLHPHLLPLMSPPPTLHASPLFSLPHTDVYSPCAYGKPDRAACGWLTLALCQNTSSNESMWKMSETVTEQKPHLRPVWALGPEIHTKAEILEQQLIMFFKLWD